MTTGQIVVGVNGSASSSAAVRWAVTEAQLRRVDLHVVVAYQWRIPGRSFTSRSELVHTAGEQVTAILDAAVSQARSIAADIRVWSSAVVGEPVPVLLEAAARADLLVVGGRGRGERGRMLSVVTSQAAAYAPCPVAVVRPHDREDKNMIVVGLDDTPDASTTAGAAFEEAALRPSSTLLAVTAVTMLPGSDLRTIRRARRHDLIELLAPWREKFPEIPVAVDVVRADAGAVLVEKSRRASLLVVGAGARTHFDAMRLGPIRLHLLHHADCPVLIAQTPD
ncbi:universal stress protein [Paractinoplanes rishiriensis]|uniref:Universal stress protein n=1 Tax=Paractinoplanes rishiriensis TaxID=1050105 RepID=A0A919K9V9_9ACTN|nr:universal stress protein [Actinoplanes rishiriensis]GIF01531.1 universal stress protein [Actinoplanes rishiriensis]